MSDTLTIRVTDSTGKFTQGVFLVPVVSANPPIITTSSPLNEATVGVAYTQAAPLETMAASSGTPPYTWALLSQTGVNAWTVGTGGKIKGTPTAAETDTLTIQVTDNNLMTAQGTFSLPVAAVLSISTTSPLPNATQGTAYSDAMAAVGGASPYSWSLLSQTGTNAWSMTGANVVGTPGNVETDQLTIQVTDSIFDTVQGVFSLNVNSASSGAITFSPNSGAPPQTVTITSNPAGTIYYTSDGSTPYFWPSELYYAPVLVTVAPTTLQALSYQGTQTKQQYSTTGITPGVNFWVAGGAGTGRGNPPNGTFALFSDQAGTNGAFAVNTWNAGQYTGFQPNNKATAQLAYLGTGNANTTTAQYEGNTIGAYLVASEGYANGNSDQMIAAQTFFNGLTIFNNSNAVLHESMLLQVPTSSGTKPWAPIKHYFDGSANGRPSFDVFILLWRASGGTGIATNIDTHGNNISGPNGAITLSVPLVPANSTYVTIAPGSTTYTSGAGSTWNGFLPFSYSMSYAQIVAALTYINANIPGGWTGGTNFGTDPSQYVITNIHGNFEIQNLTASDTDVLGWSMQNFCSSLLTAPSSVGSATYSSGGTAPSAPANLQVINQGGPNASQQGFYALPSGFGGSGGSNSGSTAGIGISADYQGLTWLPATQGTNAIAKYNIYRNGTLYDSVATPITITGYIAPGTDTLGQSVGILTVTAVSGGTSTNGITDAKILCGLKLSSSAGGFVAGSKVLAYSSASDGGGGAGNYYVDHSQTVGSSGSHQTFTGWAYNDTAATNCIPFNFSGAGGYTTGGPATIYAYTVTAVDTSSNEGPPGYPSAYMYQGISMTGQANFSYGGVTTWNDTTGAPVNGPYDVQIVESGGGYGFQPVFCGANGDTNNHTYMCPTQHFENGAFKYFVFDIKPNDSSFTGISVIPIMRTFGCYGGVDTIAETSLNIGPYCTPALAAGQWSTCKIPFSALTYGLATVTGTFTGVGQYQGKLTITAISSMPFKYIAGCVYISGPGIPANSYTCGGSNGGQGGWTNSQGPYTSFPYTFDIYGPNIVGTENTGSITVHLQASSCYKTGWIPGMSLGAGAGTIFLNNIGFTTV